MNNRYTEDLHSKFGVSVKAKDLFEKVARAPTQKRKEILGALSALAREVGLAYALFALYRQQINSGFVLTDPLKPGRREEKRFFDPHTGITFLLQWNPDRELRKNHAVLIKRSIIGRDINQGKLINKDEEGRACYLCKANIALQNPGEILLEIDLGGELFHLGANFASITNNHFTVITTELDRKHRLQEYRKEIPRILNEFTDRTGGIFRTAFNGAGYSIDHEHFQVTNEEFPLEQIKIEEKDIIYEHGNLRVSRPDYYLPLWLVEGKDKPRNEIITNKIVKSWNGLDEENHRENIITARRDTLYRTFILLRDRRRLAAKKRGKRGGMASFEAGGNIVLSYQPRPEDKKGINEKKTFDTASLETVKGLLEGISPEREDYSRLAQVVDFSHSSTGTGEECPPT